MAKKKEDESGAGAEELIQQQAQQQTGQQQIRLRVDERNMNTSYANAFRTNGTAEEVLLDFGLNLVVPGATPPLEGGGGEGQPGVQAQPGAQSQPEIMFQVNDRVILNYYSAKRLAITLSQLIRRHEEQFGELELDVSKRRTDSA
jgi:hypothetical protein